MDLINNWKPIAEAAELRWHIGSEIGTIGRIEGQQTSQPYMEESQHMRT